jgi:serine/threonine protein kinase
MQDEQLGDPRVGSTLAGYRVGARLGRGGMGVVYRAEHLRLGRLVALKIVAPELAGDPAFAIASRARRVPPRRSSTTTWSRL